MLVELSESDPKKANEVVKLVNEGMKGTVAAQKSRQAVAGLLGLNEQDYAMMIKNSETKNHRLLEYVSELRKYYKVGLLSNILKGGLKARFNEDELNVYFDTVVASGDIGYAKPDPVAYEITASNLGVRLDECLMIDDRQDYCEGAIHVGMQAILYKNFEQMKLELEKILADSKN